MKIITEHPIAFDSYDHVNPLGAVKDRHDATDFCKYIIQNWPEKKTLLDLGTATGTVVVSAMEMLFDAYGIEGTDAPRKQQIGNESEPWTKYGEIRLFNADLRFPFQLYQDNGNKAVFDIITAWEVLEHIPERSIDNTLHNIMKHLKVGGFFMGTISDSDKEGNAPWHPLIKSREWWIRKFGEFNFIDRGPSPALNLLLTNDHVDRQFWFERIK